MFDNDVVIACWKEIRVQCVWTTGKLNFFRVIIEHHFFSSFYCLFIARHRQRCF